MFTIKPRFGERPAVDQGLCVVPRLRILAVKATPNPHLLRFKRRLRRGLLQPGGTGALRESRHHRRRRDVHLQRNARLRIQKSESIGAILNLDDITHIEYLEKTIGLPEVISVRYNPGSLREGNAIIGNPEEAKYGLMREQIFEAYRLAQRKGVKRFGLHSMVASNELNLDFFVETARMLFELAREVAERLDIRLEFINLGGGIGIPYRPEQQPVDLQRSSAGSKSFTMR